MLQILLNACTQCAGPLSVDDVDLGKTLLLGRIKVSVHNGFGFINEHSANIQLQPHGGGRVVFDLSARCFACRILDQTDIIEPNLHLDNAELHADLPVFIGLGQHRTGLIEAQHLYALAREYALGRLAVACAKHGKILRKLTFLGTECIALLLNYPVGSTLIDALDGAYLNYQLLHLAPCPLNDRPRLLACLELHLLPFTLQLRPLGFKLRPELLVLKPCLLRLFHLLLGSDPLALGVGYDGLEIGILLLEIAPCVLDY